MKRTYIITLLLSLCSLVGYAQDSLFDKFSDMEGVSSVYISKTLLSMMPDVEADGIDIGKIANKLESIQILSCEKPALIDQLRKETAFISPKNGYEELMRVKEDGELTTIYLKKLKSDLKEFVLRIDEKDDEFTLIVITGSLTAEEIKGIIDKD